MVGIGGVGETMAEPTADTSGAVLTISGIAWLAVAVVLVALATSAVVRHGGRRRAPG
jgi:hypothetical protein